MSVHMGIDGNEITDQLGRQDSSHPLVGPEPTLGITVKVARVVIRGWKSRKHEEYQQSICGQWQDKGFLKSCWGLTQLEQKPTKNNDEVADRTVSFKRSPVETRARRQSQV